MTKYVNEGVPNSYEPEDIKDDTAFYCIRDASGQSQDAKRNRSTQWDFVSLSAGLALSLSWCVQYCQVTLAQGAG